jgi:hypothetical protein
MVVKMKREEIEDVVLDELDFLIGYENRAHELDKDQSLIDALLLVRKQFTEHTYPQR